MTRLKKLFVGLGVLLLNPSKINLLIRDADYWLERLGDKYPNKFPLKTIPISRFWNKEFATLQKICSLEGSSLTTDLVLLKSLASRFSNTRYFEIGTWRGESAINLADVCETCTTLNLSKEEMTKKWGKAYADLHGILVQDKSNIKQIWADSMQFDFAGLGGKYDLIFIDGNHTYSFVKNDTVKVFRHLLHQDSIVVWHDYGLSPEKMRPEVLLAILDAVPEKLHERIYHVSNTLCAVYLPFSVDAEQQENPVFPSRTFRISIELEE